MHFSLYAGFRKTFKLFCNNTTLNAYQHMFNEKRSRFERMLWCLINLSCLIVTLICVIKLWEVFMLHPTVTTLISTTYPVTSIPFPGVSICSINKISRKKADYLARYLLSLKNNTDRDYDYDSLMNEIATLIHLYDYENIDSDAVLKFQNLLEDLQEVSNISLEVNPLLKYLYPDCADTLIKCRWGGNAIDCSKIFQLRLTYEGYCCLFNYQKKSNDPNNLEPKLYFQEAGFGNGLSVWVNSNTNDYFRSLLGVLGTKIHILHAGDFPDPTSGSFSDIIVSENTESFINIMPTVIKADDSVKSYPVSKRRCYFENEKKTVLGNYSQSDCFVDCKIKSMIDLCECVPFMIPYRNYTTCTLMSLPCLSKYRQRWNTQKPIDTTDPALNREYRESVICKEFCYPTCDDVLYKDSTISVPIFQTEKIVDGKPFDSIVHVFYRRRFGHLYKQDVVLRWFEMLSNYGGMFGLFIGLSLISIMEVFVHFTYKWFILTRK